MLCSIDEQIYQEVAKFFIAAACVFCLDCQERVLKIRFLRLLKTILMLLLQLPEKSLCNFLCSLAGNIPCITRELEKVRSNRSRAICLTSVTEDPDAL